MKPQRFGSFIPCAELYFCVVTALKTTARDNKKYIWKGECNGKI
jgi:hypothetical protein